MFQKPMHFDRTGVRVVAMCPGYTISNMIGNENTLLVPEWKIFFKRHLSQPYAL
jgi:NAD(P)-dependent dehydrogenase (short-subunit alcohol dehydrogenase family)